MSMVLAILAILMFIIMDIERLPLVRRAIGTPPTGAEVIPNQASVSDNKVKTITNSTAVAFLLTEQEKDAHQSQGIAPSVRPTEYLGLLGTLETDGLSMTRKL
jgi:hypothetical protein